MRAILLATVLTCLFPAIAGTAAAQSLDQQWQWCRGDYSERLIRACTAVIESHRQTPENLARAFFYRGRAQTAGGQYDRAIHDFGEAIRLDPSYPDAFNFRGVALAGKGQFEQAIADFDQAIRLDPNYAVAIYNRGLAAKNLGHAAEAARFFDKAKQAGPRLNSPGD